MKCGRPLEGRVAEQDEFAELTKGLPEERGNTRPQNVCSECFVRDLPHDECIAPFSYAGPVRDSLMRFKYHDRPEYARFFAAAILHYGREKLKIWRPSALVPVPVHRSRLAKRGYDQAFLIAKELSALTGIPVYDSLIIRNKRTEAQKELTFEGRRKNISDAFAYSGKGEAPKRAVIVDDIFTTGSTMGTIAGILKENGTEKAYGACVCS